MYSIYSKVGDHRVCLHEDTVANEMVKVLEPKLTLEDNAAGSLTFKLAPNNLGYDEIAFSDTIAAGMVVLDTYDALDILVEGGIDTDGTLIDDSKYIRTTYIDIPDGTIAYSLDVKCVRGVYEALNYMEFGSPEDPDDPTKLTSNRTFDISLVTGDFTIVSENSEYDPVETDYTNLFVQGGIDSQGELEESSTKIRTSRISVTTNKVHFKFQIELSDENQNDLVFAVYAYDNQNALLETYSWFSISEDQTIDLAVGTDNYIIVIRHSDEEATTTITNFTSIEYVDSRYAEYSIYMYDENDTFIDKTAFTKCGIYQPISFTGQKYAKIVVKYDTDAYISRSYFSKIDLSRNKDVKWALHEYSGSINPIHLAASDFTASNSMINLQNREAKAIRIVLEYDDESEIYVYDPTKLDVLSKKIATEIVTTNVDMVSRMTSTITVYRKEKVYDSVNQTYSYVDKEIWEGRVLNEDKDFWNLRTIYCEGELSYLNDTCQPQREYANSTFRQFLESVLNIHNSRVPDSKKFYVGQIYINNDTTARYLTNFEKTMETINKLIKTYKGHIKIRKVDGKRYIDWFNDYGQSQSSTQTIEFGTNLLDFTSKWDMTDLCTVLLPTGKVITQGGSTSVGDPLELNNGEGPTPCQLLYQDPTTKEVFIEADPSLAGYKTAVAVVEPEKNYYFSARLHGGYVAYVIKSNADGTGDYFSGGTQIAGSSGQVGFVDYVDQKITIPAGAHSVVMCSFGDDIQLALKNEKEAVENLDTYLTIEEVEDDDTWHKKGSFYVINQEAVDKYGWIENRLDLQDIEDKDALYKSAKLYLQNGQFDQMTIELTAMDMNLLGANTDYIQVLDKIRVISKPHGLDKYFPLTKLEIPLDKPAEMKFTLGTSTDQTLTTSSNNINEDLLSKIAEVPSMSKTLASAKANAAEMINTATNGYVTFVMDEEGNPKELLISDAKDVTNPLSPSYTTAKVWRWNMSGLAYSSQGYHFDEHNLRLALTADGSIVADRITTGILRAIQVRGCTIVVGGIDQQTGSILIKPQAASGDAIKLDNGQIQFGDVDASENFDQHSDIKGDIRYQVGDDWVRGVRMRSDVIALDCGELWIDGKNGGDPRSGVDSAFSIRMANGNDYHFGFRRGILIEAYEESSNNGEE